MLAIKHIHLTLAILSIVGFLLRSYWLFNNNDKLQKKPIKIIPHIIDTLLLVLGVVLLFGLYGGSLQSWLLVKLVFIALYIFFGIKAFKAEIRAKQIRYFVHAVISFVIVFGLASSKPMFW